MSNTNENNNNYIYSEHSIEKLKRMEKKAKGRIKYWEINRTSNLNVLNDDERMILNQYLQYKHSDKSGSISEEKNYYDDNYKLFDMWQYEIEYLLELVLNQECYVELFKWKRELSIIYNALYEKGVKKNKQLSKK